MKHMSKIRIIISFVMVLSLGILPCSVANATPITNDTREEYSVEWFDVVSKNTITGEITTESFNTSLTTTAKNSGITVLSTPAHNGTDDNFESCSTQLQGGTDPDSVIGTDTRYQITNTTQGVYKRICSITAYWSNGSGGYTKSYGTGFLEGPSAVVTAGHVIYNSTKGGWCHHAEVCFARNGSTKPYGTQSSTTIHTSQAWINSSDSNQDWAVIEIDDDIGNTTGWFGKLWTSNSLNGTSISVTGYPGDKTPNFSMWRGNGYIVESLSARLGHDADTAAGESGAAILNSSNQALGIHTGGTSTENYGTRITEWLYNYLEQFRP